MTDEVAAVLADAYDRVTPTAEERTALATTTEELIVRAETAIEDLPVEADVLHVGSTARETYRAGDRDIDLFVRFPPSLDRSKLTAYGLTVGHETLPEGREEYAEHPYVKGEYNGFDVDIVPCYDVASPQDIRSAVDRTPFHDQYLSERIDDATADEVRLAKGFCSGIGVYGSDLKTQGFSGYLVELLVVHYGSFRDLLAAGAEWTPPVTLDPESHGRRSFDDSLIVIDPTDPHRNVAAVLSDESFTRFQHHARAFLAAPSLSFFTGTDPPAVDEQALQAHLDRRDTTPLVLRFSAPDLIEDDLYPQLRTSQQGIIGGLSRNGFEILRSTTAVSDGEAIILVEPSVDRRPSVERHEGPPVHVAQHATEFFDKYDDDETVYGPFIDDTRYVVERPRAFTTPVAWLKSEELTDVKHGAALTDPIANADLYCGTELTDLLPTFETALARYFSPQP